MNVSYRTRLGYRSYPLARDRWACSIFRYPWHVPRKMVIDYWGSPGNFWGEVALFHPVSHDVDVDAGRELVTYRWPQYTPDTFRELSVTFGSGPIGSINKFTRPTIKLSSAHLPFPFYIYVSTVDPRDYLHANWEVSRSEWYATVGGIPNCPYDIHPAYWNAYDPPFDWDYYGPGHVPVTLPP